MKIALTVGSFNSLGGIERVTVQLAHAYQRLGHDVTVFATDWDPSYNETFEFVRVGAVNYPAWLRTLTLHRAVDTATRKRKFDFIHAQGTSAMHMDLLTFHSVHAAWVEVSVAEDGAASMRGLLKRYYPFHRAAVAIERQQVAVHRGAIHACSEEVRQEVIKHYGAAPERVFAQPWGIEPEMFAPSPQNRAKLRASWGIDDETVVLLLVANEFHRKGLAPMIQALGLLQDVPVRLVVAGRDDPAPYLESARQLGVAEKIFFAGHVQVHAYYQASDIFVLPSTYEGWGLVLGEAMAAGLPAVTSAFPGSRAMVDDGINGVMIIDPRDPVALANAIRRVIPERAAMGTRAQATARKYDWTAVANRLLALSESRW